MGTRHWLGPSACVGSDGTSARRTVVYQRQGRARTRPTDRGGDGGNRSLKRRVGSTDRGVMWP